LVYTAIISRKNGKIISINFLPFLCVRISLRESDKERIITMNENVSMFTQIIPILVEIQNSIKRIEDKHIKSRWLDIKGVVEYTSLSTSTIRRAIQKGELKVSNKTGKLLFKLDWIQKWLES